MEGNLRRGMRGRPRWLPGEKAFALRAHTGRHGGPGGWAPTGLAGLRHAHGSRFLQVLRPRLVPARRWPPAAPPRRHRPGPPPGPSCPPASPPSPTWYVAGRERGTRGWRGVAGPLLPSGEMD